MMQAVPTWLVLVLGGACFALINQVAVPPVAWLALVFLLHASRSIGSLGSAVGFWLVLVVSLIVGYRVSLPASGLAYYGIAALCATIFALPFLIDRLAAREMGLIETLIFPLALVAAEFLRSSQQSSWGSLAYTQYGVLPLMQLAAIGGIWAITFLMAWCELAWRTGFAWSAGGKPLAIVASISAAVVLAGELRLVLAPTDRPAMRIATINRPLDLFAPGEMTRITEGRLSPSDDPTIADKLQRLHDWFIDHSRREARAGAHLIVWPEANLLVFKEDEPEFVARAQRLAAEEHVYLAMGMATIFRGDRLPFENKLLLIEPAGRVALTYVKEHPVMGWEASIMRPGHGGIRVLPAAEGRISGAICFDADFPGYMRQAGAAETDLFVLPVNEWRAIKDQHFQMHVFRAIENGMPIVRAAATGLSAAIDPWGRVLAVADHFAPGDPTMVAQVPIGRVPTLYARVGDLFAWLCIAGLVLCLARAATVPASRYVHAWNARLSSTLWQR